MRSNSKAKECYNQHPSAPDLEDIIKTVKGYIERWNCQKIFLSTIYERSIRSFQESFGENFVLYVERERLSFDITEESDYVIEMDAKELYDCCKKQDLLERSVKYAEEILAIADCQYFLGAKCSGTSAALAINGGKYKDIYILPDANNIKRY